MQLSLVRLAIAAAAIIGLAGKSQAVPITQPAGLNPGDQYRLIFVTTTATTANLPGGIAAYNTLVQAEVALDPILNALGATWNAVGSTASVDARTNTGTDPTITPVGVPIYNLGGLLLASTNTDLWDGSLSTPVTFDRTGTNVGLAGVWTGTSISGQSQNALSPPALGTTSFGLANMSNGQWIDWSDSGVPTNPQRLYAMSSILTAVPEPGTGLLVIAGLLGLAGSRRPRA